METLQFQPDLSNLRKLQDEQLLRNYKAYRVGALSLDKAEVTRGEELFNNELAEQVVAAATAIVSEAVPVEAELSAV